MGLFHGVKLGRPRASRRITAENSAVILKLLAAAGIKASAVSDEAVRAVFGLPNGRSQQVVYEIAGLLGNQLVLEISSPVADLQEHPMSADAALAALQASAQLKIGGFAISGKYLTVRHGCIMNSTTADALRAQTLAVAMSADEAERDLTGEDAL